MQIPATVIPTAMLAKATRQVIRRVLADGLGEEPRKKVIPAAIAQGKANKAVLAIAISQTEPGYIRSLATSSGLR